MKRKIFSEIVIPILVLVACVAVLANAAGQSLVKEMENRELMTAQAKAYAAALSPSVATSFRD